MDRKINITDFLQFGVDALNIFILAFGVLVFVVFVFTFANMIRTDLLKKRVIKELGQKEKLRQTKTETPEEKKIRINIEAKQEAKQKEIRKINKEINIKLIKAEHSEKKLDVKALLDHVLDTQDFSIDIAPQLSRSLGFVYCIFYFQKNIEELLEKNINDDAVDWRQGIFESLIVVRFTPQLWMEDACSFIRNNLPLNLKNELIERLRKDAEFGTFSNGFDDGAGFLAFTSLPRFNGGFETSAESFWEHFEVAKIDIIEELNWLQEREMKTN